MMVGFIFYCKSVNSGADIFVVFDIINDLSENIDMISKFTDDRKLVVLCIVSIQEHTCVRWNLMPNSVLLFTVNFQGNNRLIMAIKIPWCSTVYSIFYL